MQILGLLLILLFEAQNGRSSRNGQCMQSAIISQADGIFSKKTANLAVSEEGMNAAPKKAGSQEAQDASNEDFNNSSANQQKVMKLELKSGNVTVVMMDLSIHEPRGSIIVWERGVEIWDQSNSETAADYENGVSRQALDYAWEKAAQPAHSFIVANDRVPVKTEVEELFYEDHFLSPTKIDFVDTGHAVELFNDALSVGLPATVMLSLNEPKKSFGRATAFPNSACVTFAMAMSFVSTRYK